MKKLLKEFEEISKLLSDPVTRGRLSRYMTSISKKSTSPNERKEEQEVSTREVSRNLYNEFAAVNDQHTADPREDKNQTSIEEEIGHKTLQKDFKVEEEQVVFEDKSVALKQLHEDMGSCDASLAES